MFVFAFNMTSWLPTTSQAVDFPNPHQIDPDRKTPSIQGMGLHKCPGIGFVDEVRDLIDLP
jgi:cytochrome P450